MQALAQQRLPLLPPVHHATQVESGHREGCPRACLQTERSGGSAAARRTSGRPRNSKLLPPPPTCADGMAGRRLPRLPNSFLIRLIAQGAAVRPRSAPSELKLKLATGLATEAVADRQTAAGLCSCAGARGEQCGGRLSARGTQTPPLLRWLLMFGSIVAPRHGRSPHTGMVESSVWGR